MDDDKLAAPNRHRHRAEDGKVLYEWEQTLDEMNVYVFVDPLIKTSDILVDVRTDTMTMREKKENGFMFIDRLKMYRVVVSDETVWTRDGISGEIHVQMVKRKKAEPWVGAFEAHCDEISAKATEEDRERMMRARFQSENPGFDFSDAKFDGAVPDASEWNLPK